MIETKSWEIPKLFENEFLEAWPCFGWTLKSNSDFKSDLGSKGVKITCTRDTAMPNYDRLKELGATYEKMFFRAPSRFTTGQAVMMTIFTFGLGLIVIGFQALRNKTWKKKMEKTAYPALEEAKRLMGEIQ